MVSLREPDTSTLLQVSTGEVGDIDVSGELDIATAPLLISRITALLAHPQCQVVRLDLSGVRFIDCAGLGALLRLRAQARGMGKQVALARVSAPAGRFLGRTDAGRSLLEQ